MELFSRPQDILQGTIRRNIDLSTQQRSRLDINNKPELIIIKEEKFNQMSVTCSRIKIKNILF